MKGRKDGKREAEKKIKKSKRDRKKMIKKELKGF